MSVGVTITDFVEGCRSRDGRLPFEIGAFVALEMTEALIAQGPAVVTSKDTRISADGHVAVYAPPHSATGAESARSVVDVLAHLLVASGTGVPPVLLTLVERGPSDGQWDLSRLRDELEASLVPLNRSAARRVLSRLLKETRSHKTVRPLPSARSVDDDLDALLDGSADIDIEAPTTRMPALADEDVDALLGGLAPASGVPSTPRAPSSSPPATAPRQDPPPSVQVARREPEPTDVVPRALAPEHAVEPSLDGFEDFEPKQRSGIWAVVAVLVLIVAGVAGLVLLRPDIVARITGDAPPEEPEVVEPAEPPPSRPHGTLEVNAGEGSQILFFVGRGPAIAQDLPVGVAHEFIAIADGRSPTRTVVPADAQWTPAAAGGDRATYEVAMQTGADDVPSDELELGQTGLSREGMGTPTGALGNVRVVTTPPGARVFLLIGFGTARIEDLPADEPVELLVYMEGHAPRRIDIGPSDWAEGLDGLSAQVDLIFE